MSCEYSSDSDQRLTKKQRASSMTLRNMQHLSLVQETVEDKEEIAYSIYKSDVLSNRSNLEDIIIERTERLLDGLDRSPALHSDKEDGAVDKVNRIG